MTKPQAEAERRWVKEHEGKQGGKSMTMFAIKNDEDKWLDIKIDENGIESPDWNHEFSVIYQNEDRAAMIAQRFGGHIVPLVKKDSPILITSEVEKWFKGRHEASFDNILLVLTDLNHINTPTAVDKWFSSLGQGGNSFESMCEAAIQVWNGNYVVKHEKQSRVPIPDLITDDGAQQYLTKSGSGWFASRLQPNLKQEFTDDELELRPYWAKGLELEEV